MCVDGLELATCSRRDTISIRSFPHQGTSSEDRSGILDRWSKVCISDQARQL